MIYWCQCLFLLFIACTMSIKAFGHGNDHAHSHEHGKPSKANQRRCFGLLKPRSVPTSLPPLTVRLSSEHPWHWIQSYAAQPAVLLEVVSQRSVRKDLERKLTKVHQFEDPNFHFESKEHAELLHLFSQAAPQIKEIAHFIKHHRLGNRKKYFESIYIAILNLMTRHLEMILPGEDLDDLDLPRYKEILRQVIAFNTSGNPQFDLYKIERAILGRFDLKEFVECR